MIKYLQSIINTESWCRFTVNELQTDFLYLKNEYEQHKNNSLKRTEFSYRVNKVIAQYGHFTSVFIAKLKFKRMSDQLFLAVAIHFIKSNQLFIWITYFE